MLIQCPKCKRKGDIPDRFGLAAHSVRCRTCQTQFTTVPLTAREHSDLLTSPLNEAPDTQIAANHARPHLPSFRIDGERNDIDSLPAARGPGDSHYEWPVISDMEQDDSQVELPAFTASDEPSSDDLPAFEPDSPSEEVLVAKPARLVSSPWARYRVTPATLIRLTSLAILGFFVLHGVLNARSFGTAIMAFVAGCLGLGGVLLLSKAQGAQPKLLSEFSANVRRSRPRSDLDRPIPSD
jgi:zinc-ribbon domain